MLCTQFKKKAGHPPAQRLGEGRSVIFNRKQQGGHDPEIRGGYGRSMGASSGSVDEIRDLFGDLIQCPCRRPCRPLPPRDEAPPRGRRDGDGSQAENREDDVASDEKGGPRSFELT